MHVVLAAFLLATSFDVTRSLRLTAAAEQLFETEKKMVTTSAEPIEDLLFADVLSLLDVAIETNPANLHARALRSQILLLHSYDGQGAYDVCDLLDARSDADFVLRRAARAAAGDVATARTVLRGIERIPPDAVPDPPSDCDDDSENGTRTRHVLVRSSH